ncbi:acyl-CoA dehydrogenase family protein [Mageeibacillus indolicus]|uniref:Acyl-CoA dehydrogenase, C-terminal domain protein n=1 Tax=Mageeibacillus indolicus (strain UPII9-5) TaxID=699246 RepID=D3R155_MAGIU|nr:acyl-CoA dehydrogenase family protein [Mageeibacillus indolicus]ADC90861.1 acyl-CoA dehydrogenase, C-terminal domain protein [Mageeibacillus indolicus UPII9-5]KFA57668.1 acyl-CoA dehydrogenase [Mageeibacillus indolicus 0009-5]
MIFTEQQEMIRQLARQIAEQELTKEVLDEVEASGVFPEEILRKFAKAGLFAIKVPRDLGGAGGNNVTYMMVMEEISKISAIASIYVSTANSLSSGPLLISGTKDQIQKYLLPIASGEKKVCFALTEPGAGSDPNSMTTSAVLDGDHYVLNGRKCFITQAPLADYAVVYARTDATKGVKGITAFVVDMKAPGVTCGKPEDKMGIIGCATSDIIFEDVKVPVEDRLGAEGMGFINAMKTLDVGRLGVAAQSIGVAGGALELSIQYAKERKQFGKPIAKFQAISFMLAEMATKLEAARQLTYHAAELKDRNDKNAGRYCSMAKLFASEVCNEICAKAVQIHGGYGFIKDYKVERMYRDCRVFTIYEGTSQVQQIVISNSLLK